ncbi:MAG: hypothetical protein LBV16_01110 [Elusimicrobiota bacterium]|jgi:hypothetical protein|nr:hypothetical protein [Elusimicrobiota bacterium]
MEKQIAKTISTFVGADPCVCPPLVRMNNYLPIFQINILSVTTPPPPRGI